jgi:hypothetical protein
MTETVANNTSWDDPDALLSASAIERCEHDARGFAQDRVPTDTLPLAIVWDTHCFAHRFDGQERTIAWGLLIATTIAAVASCLSAYADLIA